jgi:glycosyltransferase involved in cell wall biosynthesis
LHGKPYAVCPHGVLARFQRGVSAGKKGIYDRLIARNIVGNAALLVFGGPRECEEAQLSYVVAASGGGRAKSVVVPDGFDPSAYDVLPARGAFRKKYLNGHTGPLVLFLARLNSKKGLLLLCRAMAQVMEKSPDVRLAIVGPADPTGFEEQVHQWLRESGIELKSVVTGLIPHSEKLQALADTDVYALPSETENFGFTIFEATASRLPVVVSDTLDYAPEIASSGAGFTLQRDPATFAASILELLGNPELRRRMGENGALMARRYSVAETARKLESAYDSIVRRQPLPAEVAVTC